MFLWKISCSAGVIETDARSSVLYRHVHDLAYFLGHGFGKRTSRYGKILRKHVHEPAVYRTLSGNDSVTVEFRLFHTEIRATVLDEHVEFLETSFVKKHCYSFAGREFAFGVLGVDSFLTAAHAGFRPALHEFLDFFLLNTHNSDILY